VFLFTVAAAIKELRQTALPFMACMVRHYTMISISQQTGKAFMACMVRHYTMISISQQTGKAVLRHY
jgi:hypothetical protein